MIDAEEYARRLESGDVVVSFVQCLCFEVALL